jgi:hypothetical protein
MLLDDVGKTSTDNREALSLSTFVSSSDTRLMAVMNKPGDVLKALGDRFKSSRVMFMQPCYSNYYDPTKRQKGSSTFKHRLCVPKTL